MSLALVVRAASPEGMIVIAVIYAILAVFSKLKQAANRGKEPPKPVARPHRVPGVQPSQPARRLPAPPFFCGKQAALAVG